MTTGRIRSLLLLCCLPLLLLACEQQRETQDLPLDAPPKGVITIGGKDFTEQHILAKMTAIYLKENGYRVTEVDDMASAVARAALLAGHIDLYWEYTGTALMNYQNQPAEADPNLAYTKASGNDREQHLIWLHKADFNDTYALLMKQAKARSLGLVTISDLAERVRQNTPRLIFASNAEFYAREDGIQGLQKAYGFDFPARNVVRMDTGLLYDALKNGAVDVSVGFATDGRIKGFNLVALKDDRSFFPAYNPAPVVRQEILDRNPGIADLLNGITQHLDRGTIIRLNYLVDVEHQEVAEVVRNWLHEQQLL